MSLIALRATPKEKDYSYQPFVSIIVPVYNEERTIKKRVDNLLSMDYPKDKYEIIAVESGSTDNTYQIVKNIIEIKNNPNPSLKLIQEQERRGKASAINFGNKHAKGDVILITDANSIFDRNVLKEIMPHFKDSKVGAVGGRFVVSDPDNDLASSESFYWDLEYIMFNGESYLDSPVIINGTISAWRKNLVEADGTQLTEDMDMAIQLKRAGYKIEYEPNAIVYEPAAITARDQIIQRKRTSIGIVQCLFKHWVYFLLPHDLYSLLIFPSHKTLTMFSPFILLAIPILYIAAWDIRIVFMHFVLTLLIFAGMFTLLMSLKSRLIKGDGTKSGFSISSVPKIIYYVLLNEYLILLAWKDFIFRRYSVLWEKAESTRNQSR
jgi:cellulose synthase/poly-beta-1,6-N-acetylglucosamine synthase-like glycosyltransferase